MKLAHTLYAATVVAAATLFVAPASADYHGPPPKDPTPPTSVPEPSDAVLLLMGATGVVIGRRLHARAQRKA